ncbi:hypothetical protein E8E13_001856 [Curvularia kusanoi]|uniref:NAD(P)-binding protein n=1 Tax=Curvularia kusanoi TaxID=90978 RepID=A0A9P4WBA9_CURKU|nr:hypothetical protein E8E13_001856 [Curvularia kusanoi]
MASSRISAPPILTLPATFTALVTGARVNLGYHTALQLLRCGARVLATTRYPGDAVARYAQEHDYASWESRLRVFGADFRSAADVFALVKNTRQCLSSWTGSERLHLLVNNAAQTLTDSVSKEERAIEREVNLLEATEGLDIRVRDHYRARVRGGGPLMALGGVEQERGLIQQSNTDLSTDVTTTSDLTVSDTKTSTTSSWAQNLFSIPYEDVISAHSVNTFVPLILIRELLPLMGTPRSSTSDQSSPQSSSIKPAAYIINVSSREGIFETHLNSQSKAGHHVHTNMSKAALNMITETEAAGAWRERRVAMNTVDPGYMSAAPECEAGHGGKRPLGWGDGVGRVLWPVAVGEVEGNAVWGRFLKHFGAVEVEPGRGR